MRIGIIGKNSSGKTTIFDALTGTDALSRKGHIGIVKVEDERLDNLYKFYPESKKVNATIEFLDIPGFNMKDENIKNVDGYLLVIGAYMGSEFDIKKGVKEIQEDMIISDMAIIEKRLSRIKKSRITPEIEQEKNVLEKIIPALENGKSIYNLGLKEEEIQKISGYAFLTLRPIFVVVNEREDKKDREYHYENIPVITICGELEKEIAELPEQERENFFKEMGIQEPGVIKVIKAVYSYIGLISFFTIGKDEVRAWSIKKGTTAIKAAGKIHTDMERGFIRAQVIHYSDFISMNGSLKEAKSKGLLRLEGKDYLVQDGDIIEIRFSV